MFRIDVALLEACAHQAALRRGAGVAQLTQRPASFRRHLGAWLVRAGRAVGGPSTPNVLRA